MLSEAWAARWRGVREGPLRDHDGRLRVLEAWLAERQVQLVAMEATGVCWKPVYYALEARFTVWLCKAT